MTIDPKTETHTESQLSNVKLETVTCALCGADESKELFRGPDRMFHGPQLFRQVRCRCCGLLYLNPRPVREELVEFYPETYYSFVKAPRSITGWLKRISLALDLRHLREYLHHDARILEIGCATGEVLAALRERGYGHVEGLELSPYAARIARERYGLKVVECDVCEAPYPAGAFDLILMYHVLEHLPEPLDALRRVTHWLRPGGVIFIEIPDPGSLTARLFGQHWHPYELPRHLCNFPRNLLPRLATATGLVVERVNDVPVPNDVITSLRYLGEAKGWPSALLRWLSPGNLVAVALFAPAGWLLSALRQSSRVRVIFRKPAEAGP